MKSTKRPIYCTKSRFPLAFAAAIILAVSSHQGAAAQNVCESGETKKVSSQMGKVYQGPYKRQFKCVRDDAVYNPPPCWIIEDYDLDIGSFGNSSYSANFVAANSSFLSEQEWKAEFEAAYKLAAEAKTPKLKAELEAALDEKLKDYRSNRTKIDSSHQALQVKMSACGRGTFVQFGSLMEVIARIDLKCAGCDMAYRAHLRESLRETLDEVKRQHKPDLPWHPVSGHGLTPTLGPLRKWTPWLDRDDAGGKGDYETLGAFLEEGKACANPIDIECQTTNGRNWRAAGQVYTCRADVGGVCQNADQKNARRCLDYRVRFLCGDNHSPLLRKQGRH